MPLRFHSFDPIPTAMVCALAAVVGACGSLGGEGGGAANLPNRGIVPYRLVDPAIGAEGSGDGEPVDPADAFLLRDHPTQEFRAPAAEVDELERVDLYVEVSGGAASWIGRLTSTDGLVFGDIVLVVHPMMLASVDIDTDRVGAPSVVTVDGETRIAFSFGDDEGIAWTRLDPGAQVDELAVLLRADEGERIGSPSLLGPDDDAEWSLYFGVERPVVEDTGGDGDQLYQPPSIGLATGDGSGPFERRSIVLAPGTDCVGPDGEAESCWDRQGVWTPEVRVAETALGRRILRMWYAGGEAGDRELGFASSFDGAAWERFPFNPVVDGSFDEREPTNVFLDDRYLLYFEQSSARTGGGIAIAINDKPKPSERF